MAEQEGYELLRIGDVVRFLEDKAVQEDARVEYAAHQAGWSLVNGYRTADGYVADAKSHRSQALEYRTLKSSLTRLAREYCLDSDTPIHSGLTSSVQSAEVAKEKEIL